MPRYQAEDVRDAKKLDLEEALHDVQYQYDLYLAALNVDDVETTVFVDDDTVGIHVESDDAMQLRRVTAEAKMGWLTVLDRGESGEDWTVLVSAEEIGRKYVRERTICDCGKTPADFENEPVWIGHLGACVGTPEDSAIESEDQN